MKEFQHLRPQDISYLAQKAVNWIEARFAKQSSDSVQRYINYLEPAYVLPQDVELLFAHVTHGCVRGQGYDSMLKVARANAQRIFPLTEEEIAAFVALFECAEVEE